MKIVKIYLITLTSLLFFSCSNQNEQQVAAVTHENKTLTAQESLIIEQDSAIIDSTSETAITTAVKAKLKTDSNINNYETKHPPKTTVIEDASTNNRLSPQENQITSNKNQVQNKQKSIQQVPINKATSAAAKKLIIDTIMTKEIVKSPQGNLDKISSKKEVLESIPNATAINHQAWNQLLIKHVDTNGKVNYTNFKKDIKVVQKYLDHLQENSPQDNWSNDKKLAYWINLYNAWTVKVIIDHYPLASINDIDAGKTWQVKRVKSGNQTYSLDEVENKIIRPQFNDPRIHFAVNCAAKSCPPLFNRAFTAKNLNPLLAQLTKAFINNSNYNQIQKKQLRLSKIFEWYAVDFGQIHDYINQYSNTQAKENAKIEYLDYDWSLNE